MNKTGQMTNCNVAQMPTELVEKILGELVGQCWRSEYDSKAVRSVERAIKALGLTCKAYYPIALSKQREMKNLIRVREAEAVDEDSRYYSRIWLYTKRAEPWIPKDYRLCN